MAATCGEVVTQVGDARADGGRAIDSAIEGRAIDSAIKGRASGVCGKGDACATGALADGAGARPNEARRGSNKAPEEVDSAASRAP